MPLIRIFLKHWKLLTGALLLMSAFYTGYQYASYKADSKTLESLLNQQEIMKEYLSKESSIASLVEERLQELKANERVLERERVKIVEKPVYNISCIDEEGQALIKKYALGASTDSLEGGLE
jgi:hypothetical protein